MSPELRSVSSFSDCAASSASKAGFTIEDGPPATPQETNVKLYLLIKKSLIYITLNKLHNHL